MKPFGVERDIERQQEDSLKKKVYVKGLSETCTNETLFAKFEVFGEVVRAFILYNHKNSTSRGFGFIEFAEESAVVKCLGKTISIEGKDLLISKALERTKKVILALSEKRVTARKVRLAEEGKTDEKSLKINTNQVTDKAISTNVSTPDTCKSTKKFTFSELQDQVFKKSKSPVQCGAVHPITLTSVANNKKKVIKHKMLPLVNKVTMAIGAEVVSASLSKPIKTSSSLIPDFNPVLFMSFRNRYGPSTSIQPQYKHSCEAVRFNIDDRVLLLHSRH